MRRRVAVAQRARTIVAGGPGGTSAGALLPRGDVSGNGKTRAVDRAVCQEGERSSPSGAGVAQLAVFHALYPSVAKEGLGSECSASRPRALARGRWEGAGRSNAGFQSTGHDDGGDEGVPVGDGAIPVRSPEAPGCIDANALGQLLSAQATDSEIAAIR